MKPLFLLIALFLITLCPASLSLSAPSTRWLTLPPAFKIDVFAGGLDKPRFMATSPDGVLFVTLIGSGKVVALPDKDNNGRADKTITYLQGLELPHGIAFHDGYLYVGETHQVIRIKYSGINKAPGPKEIIVPNIPTGGHFTRTVRFGPDSKMYVSIGSSCNVCIEKDRRRAAIMRYNPDGTGGELFAQGLRNSVGIAWHPETEELWASDNGRDWLGDNLPPEEINVVKEGRHYGWPYCYGDRIPDKTLSKPAFCKTTEPPVFEMQAHSAPLGIAFYTGKMFPTQYRGDLFVAFHGSWNRKEPTGYKVVRIVLTNNKPVSIEDFVSGWLRGHSARSRPVDVHIGAGGQMYISDDRGGNIFIVTYEGAN